MNRSQVAILACVVTLRAAQAQAPAGYHVGAHVLLPDSLVEVFDGGRFRLSLTRTARTHDERALIALAESLYPSAERLLGAARDSSEREQLAAMATGVPSAIYKIQPRPAGVPEDRWWLDSFDATWIPFAVTAGAVDYFAGRLRDLARGRGQVSYLPGAAGDNGSFNYHATIHRGSEAGVAYVVELQLRWEYHCGSLCGIGFSHKRVVSFDARGNAIAVSGDTRPRVIVS